MTKERELRTQAENETPNLNELFILRVLREKSSYGYALSKRVQVLSKGRVRLPPGTLYPLLSKLTREGLIQHVGESFSEVGHVRKEYGLTEQGIATFAEIMEILTITQPNTPEVK